MKKAPYKGAGKEELYPHQHHGKYSREEKIMQVETHFLTAAVVLLAEAVISMVARGISKKISRHNQLRNEEFWTLTRGSDGYIGGEYVRGAR